MQNLHIPLLYLSLNILLQHTHQIPLHIFVDFFRIRFSDSVGYAIAGEGAAAFDVTGHFLTLFYRTLHPKLRMEILHFVQDDREMVHDDREMVQDDRELGQVILLLLAE